MALLNRIVQRIKRDYFRGQHHKSIQQILHTRPLERGTLPFMLLSMVQTRDVLSYLVALKSFVHFLNPERIVVVCDPSITPQDQALLRRHVPHIELFAADEFTDPDIPRGGTWERLFAISGFVRDHYVVQLDADTVTLQPIPEVLEAIRQQRGFVLGEMPDTPIKPLPAVSDHARARLSPGAHIQTIAEACMNELGLPDEARYVRGCSGFTGFPPTDQMRTRMLDFSRRMTARLGQDWTRWGTEQVTSNYLVANAHGTRALPFPKYGTPDCADDGSAFLHFIGSMRFINGHYAQASRQAIEMLDTAPEVLSVPAG